MQKEEEWKPFRNALDKSERKKFAEMFDIPNSVFQPALVFVVLLCLCTAVSQR